MTSFLKTEMFSCRKNVSSLWNWIQFVIANQWFVDGTFKNCPDNFYQVSTVHCLDNGITVPCIYAYNRAIELLPRTSNAIEGFHRFFKSIFSRYTDNKCFKNLQRHKKRGKQIVKESENYGRIIRIVCAALEYQPLESLRAIASSISIWEIVSVFCLLSA